MRILTGIILTILFFGLLQILFLRIFAKDWWKNKKIRYFSYLLPTIGIISFVIWRVASYNSFGIISFLGAVVGITVFIVEVCLVLSHPISGFLKFVNFLFEFFRKDKSAEPTQIDITRRKILYSTATAVPYIAVASGASGVVRSFSSANVYLKPIAFENLPDDLNGFRILHLSDLHLHYYVTLSDLENVLLEAEKFKPDIVLVTGDIADDLDLLPDTLKMIDQFKTPYGSMATLGNHEYFRGIGTVLHLFEKSPVPLFVNKGQTIQVGKSSLFIGGIDDPRHMGAKEVAFFRDTIDKTLQDEHGSDFKVLMSHRPDALDYSAKVGIDLTLAGHTHGGQMGFKGRSVLESYFPDRYLWGDYSIDKSKLYTSSGMGHWFPFRLGCPAEAPIIELIKS